MGGDSIINVCGTPNGASVVQSPKSKRSVEGWRHVSYMNCFGADDGSWVPSDGWTDLNRSILRNVYCYYGGLNRKMPTKCHWPGLGKLAGGVVVSGLNLAASVNLFSGPSADTLSCAIVRIAKNIFDDIAWQFEAYLDSGLPELQALLPDYDSANSGSFPCLPAWKLIDNDGDDAVTGSHTLLAHEQKWIIQNGYNQITPDIVSNRAGAMTSCPHPYGRSFIVVEPGGNVMDVNTRWDWIEKDMWPTWTAVAADERRRLIDLDFQAIVDRNFGALRQEFLPPGDGGEDDD